MRAMRDPGRRAVLAGLGAGLGLPAVILPGRAAAQEAVTLKLHHFLPAVSAVHRFVLRPWADQLARESDNRLRVQIFPAMQLGGAPPQLYDQARDGVADLIWTLQGYTPGRFPRTEALELPFVMHRLGAVNARVAWDLYDGHLRDEYREVHPVCLWAHDGGVIHAGRKVERLEDLAGLKLRFPTRLAGEGLRALGAAPVGMPVPQVPESLAQRVIDGAVVPWEVVPSIKLQELVRFHTEIPGSPTFYAAANILAMNRPRYEGLPAELRAVLDARSGMAVAPAFGAMWDEQGPPIAEAARRRGNTVTVLSEAEAARWRERTAPVREAWLAQAAGRGFDGAALLAAVETLVARHGRGAA